MYLKYQSSILNLLGSTYILQSNIVAYYNVVSFLVIILFPLIGVSQQSPQYSQYLVNPIVINPAITGVENYMDVTLGYRNQWTGLAGAPKTGTLSFSAPATQLFGTSNKELDSSHSGLGLFLYTDQTGPIRQSGYYLSYAYHLKVSEQSFLSLGAFVGNTQFSFDTSDVVVVQDPNDPLIQNISSANFDMSLGVYYYSKKFFTGFSANQIFDDKLQYPTASSVETSGKIGINYNFLLGGRGKINDSWQIIPSVLVKSIENAPVQWDINTKVDYQNKFWVGASYRYEESIYALAGFRFWDSFSISYSYDFPFSKLQGNQSGSHEIVLSYRFLGSGNGEKCYCPDYSM